MVKDKLASRKFLVYAVAVVFSVILYYLGDKENSISVFKWATLLYLGVQGTLDLSEIINKSSLKKSAINNVDKLLDKANINPELKTPVNEIVTEVIEEIIQSQSKKSNNKSNKKG